MSVPQHRITADGSSGFKAEAGRYHLYAGLFCPFAARAFTARSLKGLQNVVSITWVDPVKGEDGWRFTDKVPKCTLDTVNNCDTLRQVYQKVVPGYSGSVVVPTLWDKQTNTIISTESADILNMFSTEFNQFSATKQQAELDLYPKDHVTELNDAIGWISRDITIGVYKVLNAKTQQEYDDIVETFFSNLQKVEGILGKQRYIAGSQFTAADVMLFSTLIRFDVVYHGLFRLYKKRIVDYENMWGYVKEIYQMDGMGEEVVDFNHIRMGYMSQKSDGILWALPEMDLTAPHGRDKKKFQK